MNNVLTYLPTPVFNTPDLSTCFGGKDGVTLPLDEKQLLRSVETILLPHSKIELVERHGESFVWQIRTEEYPYDGNFYVDERFLVKTFEPTSRLRVLPDKDEVLKKLHELKPMRYIWGGNWPAGIPLLPQLYPSRVPLSELDPLVRDTWMLNGMDCSGLLYYVTDGWTPRNTSALINYGKPVEVEGLTVEQMLGKLQELDLIVWKGHVVLVLDKQHTIESKHPVGLLKMSLWERLMDIMDERKPANEWRDGHFVVRRWI
jgi:hypothetical protein